MLEGLKRKDASAGEGGNNNNIGFRETIVKTIHEYQKLIDGQAFKDAEDKRKLQRTIKDLKKQLEDLNSTP